MEQIVFIVWRESIEALLVVGILYSWLKQFGTRESMRYLWFGVGGGIFTAVMLAAALLAGQEYLSGNGQDIFMLAMILTAVVLIVQMVLWMRKNGRNIHSQLQEQTRQAVANRSFWSISLLVAIAIAREGSETVIFLYGMSYAQQSVQDWASYTGAVALALVLAGLSYYLLQASRRWLSWKYFFRITEVLLLLLAGALLLSAADKMMGLGWLPTGMDPLWNSSSLLSDSSRLGGILSALVGYRAYPTATDLIVWLAYWLTVVGLLRYQSRQRVKAIV